MSETAKKVRVDEYLKTIVENPKQLKEVAEKNDAKLLRMVMMHGPPEYIEMAEDPQKLIEAVKNNQDDMVFLLLVMWGVTNELINFIAGMKSTIRKNEAMDHVRQKLDEISKYDTLKEGNHELIFRANGRPQNNGIPQVTINMNGIPSLIIVKIVMDSEVTIYATLLRTWKSEGWYVDEQRWGKRTYFWVKVIDCCEELNKTHLLFMNDDNQASQGVKIHVIKDMDSDRETMPRTTVPRKFEGKVMTLITPWSIMNEIVKVSGT